MSKVARTRSDGTHRRSFLFQLIISAWNTLNSPSIKSKHLASGELYPKSLA